MPPQRRLFASVHAHPKRLYTLLAFATVFTGREHEYLKLTSVFTTRKAYSCAADDKISTERERAENFGACNAETSSTK